MRVELVILDLGVPLFGAGDHCRREIHTHAVRWFQVRDQTSCSAADFEEVAGPAAPGDFVDESAASEEEGPAGVVVEAGVEGGVAAQGRVVAGDVGGRGRERGRGRVHATSARCRLP